MTLEELYYKTDHRLSVKYPHYLKIYDKHFASFRDLSIDVLEIGVGIGGFLQVLQQYFENGRIYGLDPSTQEPLEGIEVFTGVQEDPDMLDTLKQRLPNLGVVIDDGSHVPGDQITSFEALFPELRSPGLYVVEDTQLSYDPQFGGYKKPGTFIEYVKDRVDDINAWSAEPGDPQETAFTRTAAGIYIHANVVLIEKGDLGLRSSVRVGNR